MFIRNVLFCNGYPLSFINGCIKKSLLKQYKGNDKQITYGPEKKKIVLCLPYIGAPCEKLSRQLIRMCSKVAPCVKLLVIFKPLSKLSVLSKLKCPFHLLSNSNVVYRLDCSECKEFYIGMTTRRLEQRMLEHKDSSTSAIYQHILTCKHYVEFSKPKILASDSNKYTLFIKEALLIKENKADFFTQ